MLVKTRDSPRYHATRNPAYQVDYVASSSGKHVAATKRRIRWRFGFSNAEAIAKGQTGTDCRGEEHEITLVWSLTSGKHLVLADGHEVHFSCGRRTEGRFEHSWTMRGNHVLNIIAHAAPPLRATPGFKQFDLLLDGMGFFSMPKIYELGTNNGAALVPYEQGERTRASGGRTNYNNYSLPARDEEMNWARSVRKHEECRNIDREISQPVIANHSEPPQQNNERSVSMPTDLVSEPTPVTNMQDILSSPMPVLDQLAYPITQSDTSYQQDQFTPVAAPAPTFETISTEIMSAYAPQQTDLDTAKASAMVVSPNTSFSSNYSTQGYNAPSEQFKEQTEPHLVTPVSQEYEFESAGPSAFFGSPPRANGDANATEGNISQCESAPTPAMLIGQQTISEVVPFSAESDEENKEVDQLQKSLKTLVNLDDISSAPLAETKLTMNPFEASTPTGKKGQRKSRGLAPMAALGTHASLSQLKAAAPSRHREPSCEVMKTHAFHPQATSMAGAMVVYGQQQQVQQGPPPIMQVSGFGLGTQVVTNTYGFQVPVQTVQQQGYYSTVHQQQGYYSTVHQQQVPC